MSLSQLVVGASGIYVAYLTSSILAQKLYSSTYQSIKDPEQFDKFAYPSLIVWFGSLLCAIFGFVKGIINKQPANPISIREQLTLGLLYTGNILTTNYALLYISYLDQSLGRNCRYLAVVIIGAYFSRVKKGSNLKLSPKKIIVASVITSGVLMFTLFGSQGKHNKNFNPQNAWRGYLLLAFSIIFDAMFSDSQAYSKVNFKPTANHLFTSANFLTAVIVFIFGVFKGQSIQQVHFCINHPSIMIDLFSIAVLQVVGQVSIYYVIANFKQHMFPLISTTRKVLTVLLSIFIFGHHVNMHQWLAILLVFGGLAYQLQEELAGKKNKQNEGKLKQCKQIKNQNQKTNQNTESENKVKDGIKEPKNQGQQNKKKEN